MKTFISTTVVAICLLALAACSSAPRPAELNGAAKLFQDKVAIDLASKAAPQIFSLSQKYYKQAEESYNDGEMEDCLHYSLLAATKFQTALEHGRRLQADDRRASAEQRIQLAIKVSAQQTARKSDADGRIARMEKILALRAKLSEVQDQSKAEKKKINAELEKTKAEAEAKLQAEQKAAAERLASEQALLEQTQQEKEVQEMQAAALSKIQTAEALEAKEYDPMNLNGAKTFVQQSAKACTEKRFKDAKDLAKMADEKASLAIAKAKEEYGKKKEAMKLLEERKALLSEATAAVTEVKQEQRGVVITLHDMFASGKNLVLPERATLLDRIAELAGKYPDYPLVIEGFTDAMGRDPDNLALSQARAQAVLDYLVQLKKIDFNRVKASGYGSSNPVADNSNAEGRAKNRRIEVIFLFR
jgi:flagellar motor protein MotB